MTVQVNGTDAKDVALHFMKTTNKEITPKEMSKTIVQVKRLLLKGYTKKQVIDVIDYIVDVTRITMYSFNYVVTVIDDTLKQISNKEEALKERELIKQEHQKAIGSEVKMDGESTERNRTKTERFGAQSRFREKFDFDMLKGE